jgi:hypothetical protein
MSGVAKIEKEDSLCCLIDEVKRLTGLPVLWCLIEVRKLLKGYVVVKIYCSIPIYCVV